MTKQPAVSLVEAHPVPRSAYIVCATQRSGSNLLCEALWSTGVLGRPDEYFIYWHWAAHEPARLKADYARPWLIPVDAYLQKVLEEGTTPNGVFGIKIMWSYLPVVVERLRSSPWYRKLSAVEIFQTIWPEVRYIFVTRQDKVRQAVSLAKAIQSRKWMELDRSVVTERPDYLFARDRERLNAHLRDAGEDRVVYDFEQIFALYHTLLEEDAAWESFFRKHDAAPYRVVYEEFVKAYEQTALDIARYIGAVDPTMITFRPRAMRRQSDSVNDEWTRRFKEDLGQVSVRRVWSIGRLRLRRARRNLAYRAMRIY